MNNETLSLNLHQIADLLEETEDNPYRIRAYRRAANAIKKYPENIENLVHNNTDLTIIPYVGTGIAFKIRQIVLEGIENALPEMDVKPIHLAENNSIQLKKPSRYRIYSITFIIDKILERLKISPFIQKIECTGDYRRKKEIIDNIVILAATSEPTETISIFQALPFIKYIIETTDNYCKVQLRMGAYLTLYVVLPEHFGASLIATTGSEDHFQALQRRAKNKGLLLNSKGLYRGPKTIGRTEKSIYQKLDLQFIPPELRENTDELSIAEKNQLPHLIEITDIKGDLHCHTNETDGAFTLEEMLEAARLYPYEYIAITDHSQSLKITRGMDEKRLLLQIKKIDTLNEKLTNFKILKSCEVDILEDGSLDISNDVLKELDLTVCSIHSKFRLSLDQQTERIIRAMDNPYFNILGHATGRLLNHRQPYAIDFDRILQAAKDRQCFLELNAQPARLDINDIYCRKAKAFGIKIAISSDAHTTRGFSFMHLGVNQARRGWLTAKDVLNTYPLLQLKKLLKKN